MKTFDIDVSGQDLLGKDYTICIADNNDIIKGFKISQEMVESLASRYRQGMYNKYNKSKKGKSSLKIRIYSVIVYYLFESIKLRKKRS